MVLPTLYIVHQNFNNSEYEIKKSGIYFDF